MTAPTQAPPQQGQPVSAAQLATLIALVEAQAAVRGQLTQAAIAAAVAAFEALAPDDWWESAKIDRAITAALKVVQPSQRQAARITDAYLTRAARIISGSSAAPAGVVDVTKLRKEIPQQVARELVDGEREPAWLILGDTVDGPAETINDPVTLAVPDPGESAAERLRRTRAQEPAPDTVDPADPYGRVADQYRFQIVAKGTPNEKARRYALVRIAAVAETDVTLAVREQVRKSLGKLRDVRGYRRILRPELSETGPCGLCVVAADRIYKVEDLQPIHDRCKCEVLPIIGSLDPGIQLNGDDLAALYDAGGGTGGDVIGKDRRRHSGGLKKIRVALAEHGELGPVLVDADQRHRGPREVAAVKVDDPKVRARAELAALEETFARLIRRQQAGENVDRPLSWQTRRIRQLQELIG